MQQISFTLLPTSNRQANAACNSRRFRLRILAVQKSNRVENDMPKIWPVLLLLVGVSGLLTSGPLPATASPRQQTVIQQYELFEITLPVADEYSNPYDPAVVDITATFESPTGETVRVPAFYMQPYNDFCTPSRCDTEDVRPNGEAEWRVRFTPTVAGSWRYSVGGTVGNQPLSIYENRAFTVEPNPNARGFIEIGSNPRYFAFENGESYFPIGENLLWSWDDGGGLYQYITWLDELAAAGGNYARINIDVPWFIGLEWTSPPGQYDDDGQLAAWRLDQIVEAAAERGIYLHVILIWHQAFREYPGLPVNVPSTPARPNVSADFDNHPYNSIQGGNMTGAGDILFNTLAQSWLQRRIRYVMARWAYSPTIFAWEIVDSMDRIAAFVAERDEAWLIQLRDTIQAYDPNQHLISVGTRSFNDTIQNSEAVDFSQVVLYQSRPIEPAEDQARLTFQIVTGTNVGQARPLLVSEFSLNPWFEPTADDPTGVHIRNTIWTSVMMGASGAAIPYWWDTYIHPNQLYDIFTPLSLFVEGIDWNTLNLIPIEPSLIMGNDVTYEPIRINDFNPNFRSASLPNTTYAITGDGAAPPTYLMSSYLYGQRYNTANAQPEVLQISPPVDTIMTVSVRGVSASANARLVITIDDVTALSIDLSAGTSATTFSIPLSAGHHTVAFDNTGDDWLQLEAIEIAEYRAPLRVFALGDAETGTVLAWVHHRGYTWESVAADRSIAPIAATLSIPNLPTGQYRIEFWDTFTGNIIGTDYATVTEDDAGVLQVMLLPTNTGFALRIFRETALLEAQ